MKVSSAHDKHTAGRGGIEFQLSSIEKSLFYLILTLEGILSESNIEIDCEINYDMPNAEHACTPNYFR
jgi:hypothetical protein